jgi:uncharacterized protein (DUF736 family)
MEISMPQIGSFTREPMGFVGHIHTFTLSSEVTLVPTEQSGAENAPDFRLHTGSADGVEIGAGWKRTGEKAGEYIALVIDDPALPNPIHANLFRDDETSWSLHWNRASKREARD